MGSRTSTSAAAATPKIRPLRAADLGAVIAIDTANTGRARRGFFEKRLAAVKRDPDLFLAFAVEAGAVEAGAVEKDKALAGFLIARIFRGEFGASEPIASIDAIGVAPDRQSRGLGHALMEGLETSLRKRGVFEIRSQDAWTGGALMRFFAGTGFELAPIWVLDRPLGEPVDF